MMTIMADDAASVHHRQDIVVRTFPKRLLGSIWQRNFGMERCSNADGQGLAMPQCTGRSTMKTGPKHVTVLTSRL